MVHLSSTHELEYLAVMSSLSLFHCRYGKDGKITSTCQWIQPSSTSRSHAVYANATSSSSTFGSPFSRHATQPIQAWWICHQKPGYAVHGGNCKVSLLTFLYLAESIRRILASFHSIRFIWPISKNNQFAKLQYQ